MFFPLQFGFKLDRREVSKAAQKYGKPGERCYKRNMMYFKDSLANFVKSCIEAEKDEVKNHPLNLATRRS